jgi:pimeloyl-ACP methyl ester carboxylesterase
VGYVNTVSADQIEIACDVYGQQRTDIGVVLLHGFPDDASAWRGVAPLLALAGQYVIAPYTRGCGPSRFRSETAPRSGQVAARMRDTLAVMNAFGLNRTIIVGQDWGGATAQGLAMIHPERVERLVLLNGHGLFNGAVFAHGARPSWETLHAAWYQWLFQLPLGGQLLDADRAGLTRYLWSQWSPGWTYSRADLATVLRSIENPDWAAVVVSAYQRWDIDPNADPQDAQTSRQLADPSALRQPTLNLLGARDTVDRLVDSQLGQDAYYHGGLSSITLDDCGHFLHRERPDEVAQLILDFIGR